MSAFPMYVWKVHKNGIKRVTPIIFAALKGPYYTAAKENKVSAFLRKMSFPKNAQNISIKFKYSVHEYLNNFTRFFRTRLFFRIQVPTWEQSPQTLKVSSEAAAGAIFQAVFTNQSSPDNFPHKVQLKAKLAWLEVKAVAFDNDAPEAGEPPRDLCCFLSDRWPVTMKTKTTLPAIQLWRAGFFGWIGADFRAHWLVHLKRITPAILLARNLNDLISHLHFVDFVPCSSLSSVLRTDWIWIEIG